MEKTLNKDQVKVILDNAPKGANKGLIVEGLAKQGYTIEGFNDTPKQAPVTPLAKPGYRADTSKMSTMEKAANTVNDVTGIGDLAAKGTQQLAQYVASKYPNDPILQKLADTGNQFAPSAEQTKAAGLKAASTGLALASGGSSIPATIALGTGAGYTQDVASNIEAGKQGIERYTPGIGTAIGVAAPLVAPVAGVLKALPKAVSEGFSKVPDLPTGIAEKAMNFISADPQAKVVTILKRSTPDEVASVVESARKASISGEAPTPFEITGNKLADTAKVLQTKLNEIGKAKSDIILPLREGLGAFKAETKPFIDKLTSLKNSFSEIDASSRNIVQAAINDAKTVATKMDADKLIDKLQDALYSGNQNQTIVQGSAVDKQLRGILKTYNDALKAGLPKEYAVLNDKYSKLVDTLSVINKSLGDVVEGVPIRGASLIKQYFSPSGSKAKEIFEFIKKETNGEVDLAKDATLSKFAMELFDDTRANSLLSGIGDIPTTVGGVVSKVIEKVGGEKLISSMRDSTIKKAKDLADKQSFNLGTVPKTVEDLVKNAQKYNPEFIKNVDSIAKELGFKVAHGPVKKVVRIQDKINTGEVTLETARDTNRSTILVNSPSDLQNIRAKILKQFGNESRFKDKFDTSHDYKSAIINIKTPAGHEAEIAVTTPNMWKAKNELGGQDLYDITRDTTGKYTAEQVSAAEMQMKKLYGEAAIADGLSY